MPMLDPTCHGQVERLREIVGCDSAYAVQIMPPPSYIQALFYEGNDESDHGLTSDIVLLYKANIKTSTSSLPLDVRDEVNDSVDSNIELEGNPLPAPFEENDEFDVSVSERKHHQWPKGELNHLPLRMDDALKFLDSIDQSIILDVWCLVDGGIKTENQETKSGSQMDSFNGSHSVNGLSMLDADISTTEIKTNTKKRILSGEHSTGDWWTRSFVESQGVCSLASPEMDPNIMKRDHLDIAQMPEHKMSCVVLCRYNIFGQRLTSDACGNASSVSLELKWKHPSVTIPSGSLQEATAKVIVQAAVGHKESPAKELWKQLCILYQLFELLLTCWRDKTSPDMLPHVDPGAEEAAENAVPLEPLESRISTLILGGKQALQAQNANRRMSIAPALLGRQSVAPDAHGRQSMAPGFLGRRSIAPRAIKETHDNETKHVSLSEALEIVSAGTRENSDVTDGLFNLLIECRTYRELIAAWDHTFMELNEARRPYVRPKNSTRAAKLIQGFVSGQFDSSPDFLQIEGNLQALELLIELGLEKLTTDYYYIFLDSQLIGRDELQAPQLIRAGLGVPKDKWLASCGQLLGWLAQAHSGLEIILPLQASLSNKSVSFMASKTLKYYQSEMSPVHSVATLLSPGNSLQEISLDVSTHDLHEHTNKKFDLWRMTLTSECETKRIRSIFLRSHLHPIFPPQLSEDSEPLVPVEGVENVQYYCAQAVIISHK